MPWFSARAGTSSTEAELTAASVLIAASTAASRKEASPASVRRG